MVRAIGEAHAHGLARAARTGGLPGMTNSAQGLGPCKVRSIENVWIPMSDGVRLAARLWLPEDAERRPVPALLEYIPYRRRDGTRDGDQLTHPYLAGHGYACVRLDIRGSGDSEGLQGDEYSKSELDDAVEAIAWIAAQ